MMNELIKVSCFLSLLLLTQVLKAGGYLFAGDANGLNIIAHPPNYTGSSGVVNVNVCINPASVDVNELEISVRNTIFTINQLQGINNNILNGNANNIPSSSIDWESVVLHEVGHCIGLAHPNLGSRTGVSGANTNYTISTSGVDEVFNLSAGADGIIGSADDNRGDDQNLFWFNTDINNPFVATLPFDSSVYSRELADLPAADNWAVNPDLNVAADLGLFNTEGVMQQGSRFDEDQRELGIDDEVTLRLAMTGLDEISGTGDDYTIELVYSGLNTNCDINIFNDPDYFGFAVCQAGGVFIGADHVSITTGDIRTNPNNNWFFNNILKNDLIFVDGFE